MSDEKDRLDEVNKISESITEFDIIKEAVDRDCPPTEEEFFKICEWLISKVESLEVVIVDKDQLIKELQFYLPLP